MWSQWLRKFGTQKIWTFGGTVPIPPNFGRLFLSVSDTQQAGTSFLFATMVVKYPALNEAKLPCLEGNKNKKKRKKKTSYQVPFGRLQRFWWWLFPAFCPSTMTAGERWAAPTSTALWPVAAEWSPDVARGKGGQRNVVFRTNWHCKHELRWFLGGGNWNIFFIFTPKIGEDEPILTHIFWKGLVQPPTSDKLALTERILLILGTSSEEIFAEKSTGLVRLPLL